MKKLYLFFVAVIFILSSCKNDTGNGDQNTQSESYGFSKDTYEVFVGKTIEVDVDTPSSVEFEVTNEKICEIVSSDKKTVRLLGKKSGATVLKAVCNDKTYKTVINVQDNSKNETYLMSYAAENENGFITSSFFRMNNDFLYVEKNKIHIKKENGNEIITDIDDFISLEADIYKEN